MQPLPHHEGGHQSGSTSFDDSADNPRQLLPVSCLPYSLKSRTTVILMSLLPVQVGPCGLELAHRCVSWLGLLSEELLPCEGKK